MRCPILPTVALALVLASPSVAAEKITESEYERFKLWNFCSSVDLVVEHLHKDAADIGLTREAVTVAVRSRLRAARLYRSSGGSSFLVVQVGVIGLAFSIQVAYHKFLKDPASGVWAGASTWRTGSMGMHGRDASYILSSVSQKVDRFIDEYLRVNDGACRNSN